MEKKKKGFAVMPKEKQLEIASMGGKAAHRLGRAHKWDSESARIAGQNGVLVRAQNRSKQ